MRQYIQYNSNMAGIYNSWQGPLSNQEITQLQEEYSGKDATIIGELQENDWVGFGTTRRVERRAIKDGKFHPDDAELTFPVELRYKLVEKKMAVTSAKTILARQAGIILSLSDKRYCKNNFGNGRKCIQTTEYANQHGVFDYWYLPRDENDLKGILSNWFWVFQSDETDRSQINWDKLEWGQVQQVYINDEIYTPETEKEMFSRFQFGEYITCATATCRGNHLRILTESQLHKEVFEFASYIRWTTEKWQQFLIETAKNRKPKILACKDIWALSDGHHIYEEKQAYDLQDRLNREYVEQSDSGKAQ